MGVGGRAPALAAGWVESRDLFRGVGVVGVVFGVPRGVCVIDLLAERGVFTFSFSLDSGVPTDFLCCG